MAANLKIVNEGPDCIKLELAQKEAANRQEAENSAGGMVTSHIEAKSVTPYGETSINVPDGNVLVIDLVPAAEGATGPTGGTGATGTTGTTGATGTAGASASRR